MHYLVFTVIFGILLFNVPAGILLLCWPWPFITLPPEGDGGRGLNGAHLSPVGSAALITHGLRLTLLTTLKLPLQPLPERNNCSNDEKGGARWAPPVEKHLRC